MGAVPRPSILIVGRDFTKLARDMRWYLLGNVVPSLEPLYAFIQGEAKLQNTQLLYSEINKALSGGNNTLNPLQPNQVLDIICGVLTQFSNAITKNLGVDPLILNFTLSAIDAAAINLQAIKPPIISDNIDTLATSMWDTMLSYACAPWYELYFEDYTDGQYLVSRPAPWRDIHNNIVQPAAYPSPFQTLTVGPSSFIPIIRPVVPYEIETIFLSRSDADNVVSNFFLTYAAPFEPLTEALRDVGVSTTGSLTDQGNPAIIGNNTFAAGALASNPSDWHIFGLRPLERWTPYFPLIDKAKHDADIAKDLGGILNQRLVSAFRFGEYLESGRVVIVRDPATPDPIHIGDYVALDIDLSYSFGNFSQSSGSLYYVEAVAHSFRVPMDLNDGFYRIELGLTRGEGFLNRNPKLRSIPQIVKVTG